jgi:ribose transport system permease protein
MIVACFVVSGVLSALAGVVLGAQLGIGNSSIGPEYLLPAFAASFLGATAIRPGHVNVLGTIVAVLLLSVAVDGLQQLGQPFWVEPFFDGGMLIIAVGCAAYFSRRQRET